MKKAILTAFLFLFAVTSSAIGDISILQANVNAWQGWNNQFAFAAPSDGKFVWTISNPDSSADGNFFFQDNPLQHFIKYQMLTGTCPYVYFAHPDQGIQSRVYEFDVYQSYGQKNYYVSYGPTGTQNSGVDSISLVFQPNSLASEPKTLLGSLTSQPSEQNWSEWNFSVGQSGKLVFHTLSAGNNGGSHSVYIDGRGITESFIGSPACPTWWSVSTPPGDHELRLVHEDDQFGDNTGIRITEAYTGTYATPHPPEPKFNLTSPLSIESANGSANGIFADVYGFPYHFQDPLRTRSPAPWMYQDLATFGNTVETPSGYTEVSGSVSDFQGQKELGQWSRLGQLIDPSIGLLVTEINPAGSNTWRTRDLVSTSTAAFEFDSAIPGKTLDTFNVDLNYTWQGVGMAKDDTVTKIANIAASGVGIQTAKLQGEMGVAAAKELMAYTNVLHSQFDLYGVGIQIIPDKSLFNGWTNAILTFEKADGTMLGSLEPLMGGFYGSPPFGSVQFNRGDTLASRSTTISLPVGEPIQAKLTTVTHSEAIGAAESYFGITGYDIIISGPEGALPLVIAVHDPTDAPSLTGWLTSSLVQAAHTPPFVVGSLETHESYGPDKPLDGSQLAVLKAETNNPLAGVLVPFELVSGTRSLTAHCDAFWSDPKAMDDVSIEFGLLLLDDTGDGKAVGGLWNTLFSQAIALDDNSLWSWHSGEQELTLNVADIFPGDYALFMIYGSADGIQSGSALAVTGLSADIVPIPAPGALLLCTLGLITLPMLRKHYLRN